MERILGSTLLTYQCLYAFDAAITKSLRLVTIQYSEQKCIWHMVPEATCGEGLLPIQEGRRHMGERKLEALSPSLISVNLCTMVPPSY